MPEDFNANGTLTGAIAALLDQGTFITSYVCIASFIGADGEKNIITDTASDQRCHESLGLLSWGLAVENARAAWTWREDTGRDD